MTKKSPTSQEYKFPLEYDVQSTFLDVDSRRGARFSKQGKGVMDMLKIRPPRRPGDNGDIKTRFLRSRTYATHSDLLRAAGYGIAEQPVEQVDWRGSTFFCAVKYTARSGRRGPIELGLMLDSREDDVRNVRGYEDVRFTLAIAAGYLIAKHELRHDAPNAEFSLNVSNNFQTPGPNNTEQFAAGNLRNLCQKLIV